MKKILKELQQYEDMYCINCVWHYSPCPGCLSRAIIGAKSKQVFWSEPDCPHGFKFYNTKQTIDCVWYPNCPSANVVCIDCPKDIKKEVSNE